MNHLEKLTRQYYDWKGYLVKGNIKVGRLPHGGWAGELDVVAYNPQTEHLVHVEPSIDADSWSKREIRFEKKFQSGREFIYTDVFPWLSSETPLEQIAILTTSSTECMTPLPILKMSPTMFFAVVMVSIASITSLT